MKKINFSDLTDRVKYGFINNKFTIILGIGTIIPIIIALKICDGNPIIGLAVVPVIYRLICNIILWIVKKSGRPENTRLLNVISRTSVFISFFILCCVSVALGKEEMGIIEMILLCICIAYYDWVVILLFMGLFGRMLGISGIGSSASVRDVGSLMNNTTTSFDRGDGSKIYQDASGNTIGMSRYNEKTGETTYWDKNLKYVGKSEKNSNGEERYFDSNLKYKGKSEESSNGYTNYYDENLKFKGRSRKNSNNTNTHFKQ